MFKGSQNHLRFIEGPGEQGNGGAPAGDTSAGGEGSQEPASGSEAGSEGDAGTDWKQHARTWEQRAKDNKAAQEAAESAAAAAEQRATDAEAQVAAAQVETYRAGLAVEYGLTAENAAKVFTGEDKAALDAQAAAFKAGRESAPSRAESTSGQLIGSPGSTGPLQKDAATFLAEIRNKNK